MYNFNLNLIETKIVIEIHTHYNASVLRNSSFSSSTERERERDRDPRERERERERWILSRTMVQASSHHCQCSAPTTVGSLAVRRPWTFAPSANETTTWKKNTRLLLKPHGKISQTTTTTSTSINSAPTIRFLNGELQACGTLFFIFQTI